MITKPSVELNFKERLVMKKIFFLLILLVSNTLYADLYVCTIVNVFGLNDNGYFVTHGWKGNYVKRKFTIDNVSGNILNTTALKTRLSNGNNKDTPVVISSNDDKNSLKVFIVGDSNVVEVVGIGMIVICLYRFWLSDMTK